MIIARWLDAFLLTLALELPVVSFLLQRAEPRTLRRVALIAFANLATHPLVWFVFPYVGLGYPAQVAVSELWAWLLEALFYALVFDVSPKRALVVSLVANAFSASVGYAILRAL